MGDAEYAGAGISLIRVSHSVFRRAVLSAMMRTMMNIKIQAVVRVMVAHLMPWQLRYIVMEKVALIRGNNVLMMYSKMVDFTH